MVEKEENGGQGPHIREARLNLLLELELHNKVEKIVGRGKYQLVALPFRIVISGASNALQAHQDEKCAKCCATDEMTLACSCLVRRMAHIGSPWQSSVGSRAQPVRPLYRLEAAPVWRRFVAPRGRAWLCVLASPRRS